MYNNASVKLLLPIIRIGSIIIMLNTCALNVSFFRVGIPENGKTQMSSANLDRLRWFYRATSEMALNGWKATLNCRKRILISNKYIYTVVSAWLQRRLDYRYISVIWRWVAWKPIYNICKPDRSVRGSSINMNNVLRKQDFRDRQRSGRPSITFTRQDHRISRIFETPESSPENRIEGSTNPGMGMPRNLLRMV